MKQATIDDILQPGDARTNSARAERVARGFWRTFRRASRHVPFAEELVSGYYCALDPKTPLRVRGTLLAALAYFVLPFDVVPDFILALGFTDDIAALTAALSGVRANIKREHRAAARKALARFSTVD